MPEELTPAILRAQAEDALRPLGQRRVELVAELEELDRKLRPVVVRAVRAEVPQRRIAALTALSTTTVGKWARMDGSEGR